MLVWQKKTLLIASLVLMNAYYIVICAVHACYFRNIQPHNSSLEDDRRNTNVRKAVKKIVKILFYS